VNVSCFPDFRRRDPLTAAACREEVDNDKRRVTDTKIQADREKIGTLDLRINAEVAEWAINDRVASALGWQTQALSDHFADPSKSGVMLAIPHCYNRKPTEGETIALAAFKVGMAYTPRGQFHMDYRRDERANYELFIEGVETQFQTRVEAENTIESTTVYVVKSVLSIGPGAGDKKEISFTLAPCH
jgi:hypothetical protein